MAQSVDEQVVVVSQVSFSQPPHSKENIVLCFSPNNFSETIGQAFWVLLQKRKKEKRQFTPYIFVFEMSVGSRG